MNEGKQREKPLGLDMDPDEALERFIGVDPGELPDSIKLRQKGGRRSDPQVLTTNLPARRGRASRLAYPLPGAPVRADVLDPSEADTIVAGDKDHRSLPALQVG